MASPSSLTYEEDVAQQLLAWATESMPSFKISDAKNKFMTINIPVLQSACAILLGRNELTSSDGRIPVYEVVAKVNKQPDELRTSSSRVVVPPKPYTVDEFTAAKPKKSIEKKEKKKRSIDEVIDEEEEIENAPRKMNIVDLNATLEAFKKQTSKASGASAMGVTPNSPLAKDFKAEANEALLRQHIADQFACNDDVVDLPTLLAKADSFSFQETFVREVLDRMAVENKVMVDGNSIYRI